MTRPNRQARVTLLCAAFSCILFVGVPDARAYWNSEYQWGIEIDKPRENDPLIWNKTNAFLWVPPNAKQIRAVLLAPANIIERRICDDPVIRGEAAKDGLALVYFQAGWKSGIMETPRVIDFVQNILDQLAKKSGYNELSQVPWITIGHSGNSQFCQAMARRRPDRELANIVIKGALPGPAKDGNSAGLAGIPILFVTGQFEEVMPPGKVRDAWWGVQMKRFADARAAVPEALITGMEDRSHGHLNWFPEMSRYVALYLHKAIAARLGPPDAPADSPRPLKLISFDSGWLSDPAEAHPPAPAGRYTGNPREAFWHFDEEMVRAWQTLYDRDRGKKEQLLAFTQDGKISPWWNGWALQTIQFRPLDDGVSFTTEAQFRDEVPQPFADAGTKLGHSTHGPIQFQVLGWAGATEQTGPNRFRIRFDREGVNGRTLHILIGAIHPGDAEYRETVAVASFDLPGDKREGAKQKLTFPPLADVPAGTTSIPLNAKTDSDLKPYYYVSYGPAVVDGDALRLMPIPARSQFPIEVKVTAYQWGRSADPKIATANTVSQTFHILNGTTTH